MKIKREVQHSVYHRALEQHSRWKPTTPQELDILLKTCALFSRSIVISDSDLNNHSLLTHLSTRTSPSQFRNSVRSGFIRRAARYHKDQQDLGLVSQQQLYRQFLKNGPELAKLVRPSHPRTLDSWLQHSEAHTPPLTWRISELAEVFASRFKNRLISTSFSKTGTKVAQAILEYIGEKEDGGTIGKLRGGKIVDKFLPERLTNRDQRRIWKLLQDSYNSNLLASFSGNLLMAESPTGEKDQIPAGPVPHHEDDQFIKDFYLNAKLRNFEELYKVGHLQLSPFKNEAHNFVLKLDKLFELEISEIEEIREKAEPTSYFNARFDALGNTHLFKKNQERMHQERVQYWARLEKAGVVLWRGYKRKQRVQAEQVFIAKALSELQSSFDGDTQNFLLNMVLEITSLGVLSMSIDIGSLYEKNLHINQIHNRRGPYYDLLKRQARLVFSNNILKRPDFRVIQKMVSRR